jgi:hypothetical protein
MNEEKSYFDTWQGKLNWWWAFKGQRFVPFPIRRLFSNSFWWCHDWLWPKQAWMGVGRSWEDKPELISRVLFNAMVHLVEKEREFQFADSDNEEKEGHTAGWKEACDFFRECYQYIKEERPKIQKRIKNRIELAEKDNLFQDLIDIEKVLDEKDTQYLTGIIKYRNYMWT